MIEIHLQKTRVLIIPRKSKVNDFKYIQFSRHDAVWDLCIRLLNTAGTGKFRLWKLDNQTRSFDDLFNDINAQYKETKKFSIDGEQIEYSTENVMSLNLNPDSLLIVEKLPGDSQEFAFNSTSNQDEELKDESSKTESNGDLK